MVHLGWCGGLSLDVVLFGVDWVYMLLFCGMVGSPVYKNLGLRKLEGGRPASCSCWMGTGAAWLTPSMRFRLTSAVNGVTDAPVMV